MQVTIGSRCWDGDRRKTLIETVKEVMVNERVIIESRKGIKYALGHVIPFGILASIIPSFGSYASAQGINEPAMAAMAVPDAIKDKILHAFDPIVELAVSLSYPIAGVMIAGGCLLVMVGSREKGMQMLQNAAIGYILVQLSPMFLKLLVGIGSTVS